MPGSSMAKSTSFVFHIRNSSYNQRRRFLRVKMRFHGSKLHRLSSCYILGGEITANGLNYSCEPCKDGRNLEGFGMKKDILLLQDHRRMNSCHRKTSRSKSRKGHV